MTKETITEIFKSYGYDITEVSYNGGFEYTNFPELEGTTIEKVEQHGGEGEGDSYYIVFKIEHGEEETYIRFNGYYSSYNGVDWNIEFDIVKPKEIMITVYETIKG